MWQIEQSTAVWRSPRFRAVVNLTRPAEGMQHAEFDGVPWTNARLLQVAVPARAAGQLEHAEDAYVRGHDVIVTYTETAHSPFHLHVCWRIVDEPRRSPCLLLEAIVSVQTRWLDSDPRVQLVSTIPSRNWVSLGGSATSERFRPLALDDRAARTLDIMPPGAMVLARTVGPSLTYGQLIFATDLLGARLVWDPGRRTSTLATDYFGGRLEKGVLRRVRSRAVLLPEERDEELSREFFNDSLAAPLPLTT